MVPMDYGRRVPATASLDVDIGLDVRATRGVRRDGRGTVGLAAVPGVAGDADDALVDLHLQLGITQRRIGRQRGYDRTQQRPLVERGARGTEARGAAVVGDIARALANAGR